MGVISEATATALGAPADHPGWRAVHAELVEYAQRVFSGLKSSSVALGRGLSLGEQAIAELRAGHGERVTVEQLLRVFELLKVPVRVVVEGGQPQVRLDAPVPHFD